MKKKRFKATAWPCTSQRFTTLSCCRDSASGLCVPARLSAREGHADRPRHLRGRYGQFRQPLVPPELRGDRADRRPRVRVGNGIDARARLRARGRDRSEELQRAAVLVATRGRPVEARGAGAVRRGGTTELTRERLAHRPGALVPGAPEKNSST